MCLTIAIIMIVTLLEEREMRIPVGRAGPREWGGVPAYWLKGRVVQWGVLGWDSGERVGSCWVILSQLSSWSGELAAESQPARLLGAEGCVVGAGGFPYTVSHHGGATPVVSQVGLYFSDVPRFLLCFISVCRRILGALFSVHHLVP